MNTHDVNKAQEITAKAVIFTRASANDLVRNPNSLKEQQAFCEDFARQHNMEVVASFEAHETGRGKHRPVFFRALQFIAENPGIQHLLVYDYDRFAKDGIQAVQYEAQLISRGAEVVACAQANDPNRLYAGRTMDEWKAAMYGTDPRLRRRSKSQTTKKEAV